MNVDMAKLNELQAVLNAAKKEVGQTQKMQSTLRECSEQCRKLADDLYAIARRIEGFSGDPYVEYQKSIRSALDSIMEKDKMDKKRLAEEIGINSMCIYMFYNKGFIREETNTIDKIEEYLLNKGYSLADMRNKAGYKKEDTPGLMSLWNK